MSRKRLILFILALLLLGGLCSGYYYCLYSPERPAPFEIPDHGGASTGKFLFISDTQIPLWFEALFLEEMNNPDATDRLFTAVAAEDGAAALFHLGDLTAMGSSGIAWQFLDTQLEKIRKAGIGFYPILGNHDYMILSAPAEDNFYHRFPYSAPSWYSVRQGGLAVVLLNSNFGKLSAEERAAQGSWYDKEMKALAKDASVKAVLVACHHSPYTNSKIVGPSEKVQAAFVPAFQRCDKGLLLLSGHAHAFEHFLKDGKNFVVLGGGGGLLHPLESGTSAKFEDLFPDKTDKRNFHYVACRLAEDAVDVTVMMLDKDRNGFEKVNGFSIPIE